MNRKYIYVAGTDYQRKPVHYMARKAVNRDPHYIIIAKFTNEAEAQNAVDAANMKEDNERGEFVRGEDKGNQPFKIYNTHTSTEKENET